MCESTELTLEDLVKSLPNPMCSKDRSGTSWKARGKRGHGSSTTMESSTSSSQASFHDHFASSGFYKNKLGKSAKILQAVARGFLVRMKVLRAPILEKLASIKAQKVSEMAAIEVEKQARMEALMEEHGDSSECLRKRVQEARALILELRDEKALLKTEHGQLKKDIKEQKKIKKELRQESIDLQPKVEAQKLCDKWTTANAQLENRIEQVEDILKEADDMLVLEVNDIARLKSCLSNIVDVVEAKSELLAKRLLQITMDNRVSM